MGGRAVHDSEIKEFGRKEEIHMSKKKLLSLALVLIMLAMLSFSTLAWFTDTDSATNDFKIGGAGHDDPDKIFSVEVKENVDGEEQPVDEMDFEHILPGDKFKKEAYVTNTGSYEQYIRVTMTISDWSLINGGVTGSNGVVTINMDDDFNSNWHIVGQVQVKTDGTLVPNTTGCYDEETDTLTVVMYLNKKLQPGETVHIMDYVSISTKATQDDFTAEGFADGFQIEIHAEAAQTENILTEYSQDEWKNAKKTFETLEAE